MRSEEPRRAVFLDRDGTINEEREYLHRVEEFAFIPGVPEAIRDLRRAVPVSRPPRPSCWSALPYVPIRRGRACPPKR